MSHVNEVFSSAHLSSNVGALQLEVEAVCMLHAGDVWKDKKEWLEQVQEGQ